MSTADTAPIERRRLLTIGMAVVLVCAIITYLFWKRPRSATPDEAAREALEAIKTHRGNNLAKLEGAEQKQLLDAITTLLPNRSYRDYFDFRPWYVWDFQREGTPIECVLFEVDNSGPHPGSTGIRITVLKDPDKVVSETAFHIGHRCYLRNVKLEDAIKGEFPIIAMETGPGPGPGPNVYKQYYARVEGRFELVRLENLDGKAARNSYYVKHFSCGPEILRQEEAEWEADLLSADHLKSLRALVWLGGTHRDAKPDDKDDAQNEDLADVQLVRKVREREKGTARSRELTRSEDRWLREAAELALNPEDYRW